MEPLSALGLAGNVVQFVQFASSLLNESRKIYNSVNGASENSERLEFIYGSLSEYCSKLEDGSQLVTNCHRIDTSSLPKDAPSLPDLAARCAEDCKELMRVVGRMKAKARSGPKIWSSFRIALAEMLKASEVEQLQKRIESYERVMVLHLCSVSNAVLHSTDAQIRGLRLETRSIHLQRSSQLNELSQQIRAVYDKIRDFTGNQQKASLSTEEIESLTSSVSQLSMNGKELAKEDKLLQSLNYQQRPARYDNIAVAHRGTFSWMPQTTNLVQWLASGQGTFWISGRPGSGKSTFMKFIAEHPSIDQLLSDWAGSKPFIKACHYFWSPGTPIQRSQEGLYRSLLYDILSQAPKLIRTAYPGDWGKLSPDNAVRDIDWTLSRLTLALRCISSQDQLPFKVCFFIDGLDEYAGSYPQLCNALEGLAQCPAVKLLLSSRPLNDFEDHFGKDFATKLYIHELTKADIRNYTESCLMEHEDWQSLVQREGNEQAMSLIEEISSRSHGVFLWVSLVTKKLQEGLINCDTFSDLQEKLRTIPTDLEDLFRLILKSVDPIYHKKMAGTLLVALEAREPLLTTLYSFHDKEYDPDGKDYAFKEEIEAWDESRLDALRQPFARRLKARCKLLLEVQGNKVEFLHRTVRDFLREASINDLLVSKAPDDFIASISILRAYSAWIKHKSFDANILGPGGGKNAVRVLDKMLTYVDYKVCGGVRADNNRVDEAISDILDDVENSLNLIFPDEHSDPDSDRHVPRPSTASLLFRQRLLLRGNLTPYITSKLDEDDAYLNGHNPPPLAIVLGGDLTSHLSIQQFASQETFDRTDLLEELLRRGHNPNGGSMQGGENSALTPWVSLMQELLRPGSVQRLATLLDSGAIHTLLRYRADANAGAEGREPIWLKFLLASCHPGKEAKSLLRRCKDPYVHTLDELLSNANLDKPASWIREKPDITCRRAAVRAVTRSLEELGSTTPKPDTLYFKFLSRTVEVFLKHVVDSSVTMDKMRRVIQKTFPSSMSSRLRGLISSLSPPPTIEGASCSTSNLNVSTCRKRDRDSSVVGDRSNTRGAVAAKRAKVTEVIVLD